MAQSSQSPREGSFNVQYRNLRPAAAPQLWNQSPWSEQPDALLTLPPILSEQHNQPTHPAPTSSPPVPKKMRATRACYTCRARKQKCDEATPCEFCRENDFECHYNELPLRKQDPNVLMMQRFDLMDKRIDVVEKKFDCMGKRFDRCDQRFDRTDQRFDRTDQRFNHSDQRFDRIEQKIDSLSTDITYLLNMFEFLVDSRQDQIKKEQANGAGPSNVIPQGPIPPEVITGPIPPDVMMGLSTHNAE